MIRAKNYETVSTFGKVMQRKLLASFFPDTLHILELILALILLVLLD